MALTKFQKFLLPEKAWENKMFQLGFLPYIWALKKWKIVVPILIVFFVLFMLVLTQYKSQFLKSHIAFQAGYKLTLENTEIQEVLGDNIKEPVIVTGSAENINSKITAKFTVNMSGSKGKGVLTIKAYVKDDEWYYEELIFKYNSKSINILK